MNIILLIILGIPLLLLLWVLFAPMVLFIDSSQNSYYVGITGLIQFRLIVEDTLWQIQLRIFEFPAKNFRLDQLPKRRKKKKTKKKKQTKKKRKFTWDLFHKLSRIGKDILQSFNVKYLYLNVDTEDVIANARLIPVFAYLNNDRVQMQVNYVGERDFTLLIANRIAKLAWHGIRMGILLFVFNKRS